MQKNTNKTTRNQQEFQSYIDQDDNCSFTNFDEDIFQKQKIIKPQDSTFKQKNDQITKDLDNLLKTIEDERIRDQVAELLAKASLEFKEEFAKNPDINGILGKTKSIKFILGDYKIAQWFFKLNKEQQQLVDLVCQYDNNFDDDKLITEHLRILRDESKIRKLISGLDNVQCAILSNDPAFFAKVISSDIKQFKDFVDAYAVTKRLNLNDNLSKTLAQHPKNLAFITTQCSNAQLDQIKKVGVVPYINKIKSNRLTAVAACIISSSMLCGLFYFAPTSSITPVNAAVFIVVSLLVLSLSSNSIARNNRIIKGLDIKLFLDKKGKQNGRNL